MLLFSERKPVVDGIFPQFSVVLEHEFGALVTGTLLNISIVTTDLFTPLSNSLIDPSGNTCSYHDRDGVWYDAVIPYTGGVYGLYMPGPGDIIMKSSSSFNYYGSFNVSVSKSTFSCTTSIPYINQYCPMINYATPDVDVLLVETHDIIAQYFESGYFNSQCLDGFFAPLLCQRFYRQCDDNGVPRLPCSDSCYSPSVLDELNRRVDALCGFATRDVCTNVEYCYY